MKVLEINVYNYRRGGSETVFFNTIRSLESHGHEVVRFTLKWDDNEPDPNDAYFPQSKDTRRGPLRPLANIVTYFYHFEAARKLDALIRKEKPDIAQVHLIWGQLSPSILKVLRKHHIPVVLTAHDFRIVCPAFLFRNGRGELCEQCQGKHFGKCIANKCCKGSKPLSVMMAAEQYFRNAFFNPARMADGMLFVSNFSRDKHYQYMPALKELPAERIYNSSQHIDSEVLPKPTGSHYYLYFGRLSDEKGICTLIDAFKALPDCQLKVVGSGPIEDNLRQMVAEQGLSNVEFLGYRKGKELDDLVRGSRFVVVPSECYENNPLTVVEAYSCATPVIGARIGGIPEIVLDGETGFLFTSGDREDLVSALRRAECLTEEQYNTMRVKALDFARSNFDSEKAYQRLEAFFDTLIKKK